MKKKKREKKKKKRKETESVEKEQEGEKPGTRLCGCNRWHIEMNFGWHEMLFSIIGLWNLKSPLNVRFNRVGSSKLRVCACVYACVYACVHVDYAGCVSPIKSAT